MKRFLWILLIGITVMAGFNACAAAEFEISSITVTPGSVVAGDSVVAEANVSNVGGAEGVFTANVTVNGKLLDFRDIVVAPGATERVSFTCCLEEAGVHTIAIGAVRASVTVLDPAEFQVGPLVITPEKAGAGEPVTVKADVTNIGGSTGVYTAALKVNGVDKDTREVTLDAGATQPVSFTLVEDIIATYNIEIGGQTATLRVLKPAEFKLDSLIVEPNFVVTGSPATAKVDVTNVGGAAGTYEATLEVNDVEVATKEVTISGGETKTVSFDIVRNVAGTYYVEIGGLVGSFQAFILKTYHNPAFGYSISHPAIRELVTSDKAYVHFVYRKDYPTLVVEAEVLEEELTVDEYYQADIDKRKSQFTLLDVLSTEKVREAEALPGYLVDCNFTEDGTLYRARALYMVSGRLAFCASVNVPADRWDFFTGIVAIMLDSFKPPAPDFADAWPLSPVGFNGHFNWEHDVFIAYPEGWIQQEVTMGKGVQFVGPEDGGFYPNFVLQWESLPRPMTVKEYCESGIEGMKILFSGYKGISTKEIMVDDVQGREHIYTFPLTVEGNRITVKIRQVYLIRDMTAFTVTCGFTLSKYDKYADTYDTIVNSLRFLK